MEELVTIENNAVVVSSRDVAEHFDKQHKDVLESIRNILAAENSAVNFFKEYSYLNRGKEYPAYYLNRDGFSLLVMGFTGQKALEWKIKYINAFNDMEKKLQAKALKPATELQAKRADTMLMNARTRQAKEWEKLMKSVDSDTYKKICQTYIANTLAGKEVFELPESEKTYSATEVGDLLGISAVQVGKLANKHNFKIPKYGKWYHDKSPYSAKEVDTFRYNALGVNMIKTAASMTKDENGNTDVIIDVPDINGNISKMKLNIRPKK